ncbi:hypothetical protein SAMN05421853_106127 [Roseivivax halotolerans]|uniref:DUF2125 domain-containing protein n=1 Tax=Roseivivax halotolerans TaxID=93684 RepID=A0A1I5YP98_9RHOB|nr:DUF2125 domain-containing protein [Roseivivax halotolerans]SFQ45915.1 hypothetical protein SAMN05421853_106127 [Roseivivax halotolerans]
MKRLTLAVILAALLWSGLWVWQARALRAEIDTWFEARRAEGWTAEASEIAVRGFPNRLDARFSDLVLAPEDGPRWQVPELQVMRLVYRPNHLIVAASGEQIVERGGTTWRIDGEGLRASAVWQEGRLDRVAAESGAISLAHNEAGSVHLAQMTAALQSSGGPEMWRAAFNAYPAESADAAATDARVTLNAMLGTSDPTDPRTLREIDLSTLEYADGAGRVALSGPLSFGSDGRATGTLALRAEDWEALLEEAQESGRLPAILVPPLQNVLSVLGRISGGGNPSAELRIDDGRVRLGPLPLGRIPALPRS